MRKSTKEETIDIIEVTQRVMDVCVIGERPVILNRVSEKAQRELLYPYGRKGAAERATSLKHDPLSEFQASPYRLKSEQAPTLLALPSAAFKQSMLTASLDLPGTKKAQIGRLMYVQDDYTALYGIPELFMAIVRSADFAHTPDVRTRAILPKWACRLSIKYTVPLLRDQSILRLLAAAGICCGVGDGRLEKGKLSFGMFRICSPDDPDFKAIVKTGGRKAQAEAMRAPACYDEETAELLSWFEEERGKRAKRGAAAA